MGMLFKNLNKKLEEKMEKDPFYIKTKHRNYINIMGTGQGGTILIEAIKEKLKKKI